MPNNDYFAAAAEATVIHAPAAVAADGNSAGVDITALVGHALVIASINNTAGTTPTMDVKLQSASTVNTVQTVAYSGTGDGTITEVVSGPDAIAETITVELSSASAFAVTGSTTGAIGSGTVGTLFTSQQLSFLISAGAADFVNHDAFTIHTHAVSYSDVTGGAFAQVEDANSLQSLAVNVDSLGGYLRANFNIAGTDAPSYTIGLTAFNLQGK